jgi:hypothetical protein
VTITLHWWYVPIALVVLAFVLPMLLPRARDWDFVTPIVGLAIFIGCLAMAAAFALGHLFA